MRRQTERIETEERTIRVNEDGEIQEATIEPPYTRLIAPPPHPPPNPREPHRPAQTAPKTAKLRPLILGTGV